MAGDDSSHDRRARRRLALSMGVAGALLAGAVVAPSHAGRLGPEGTRKEADAFKKAAETASELAAQEPAAQARR